MDAVMIKLFNMSLTAVWLILAVIVLRLTLKKAPKYINIILWGLVGFRLVCPFSFESILSLIPVSEPIPSGIQFSSSPNVDTGFDAVNEIINPAVSEFAKVPYTMGYSPIDMILRISFAVWLAGVAIIIVYSLISYALLRRKVRVCVRYDDNIYLCDNIKTPFILGIIKPKIYLPSDINASQISSVTAHEKSHISRLDHIWKTLGFSILCVHWFNPLVWLSYNLFCRDIEYACDEKVIKTMATGEKKEYSETLLSLSSPKQRISACPLAFGEVSVKSRIKSVLSYKKPAIWLIVASVIALVAVALGFMTNPAIAEINGKVYAPKKFYHQEVIGEDRANKEQMDDRYYISDDFVLSRYSDDGMNYFINQQGQLVKQEQYDEKMISLIIEKLPDYYNHAEIKEVYYAELSNDLTEPKDLYVILKYSNGDLILSYLPSGSGECYVHEVLKLKSVSKNAKLHSEAAITGTKGSTDCDGVTVKIIEAVYFSENPYIKVQWDNNTGDNMIYGSPYSIYRYENGEKVQIDISLENFAWNSLAYVSGETTGERIFSLEYYDLSVTGLYTLEFEFSLESDNQKDYTAVLEFEIVDIPSSEPVSTSDPSVKPETPIFNTELTTTAISSDDENVNPYFDAKVLEVNENNILVEPLEGEEERNSASKIYVSTDVISENPLPEIKKGDTVRIIYNGQIQETYPAQISDVFAIYPVNQ